MAKCKRLFSVLVHAALLCYFLQRAFLAITKLQERKIGSTYTKVYQDEIKYPAFTACLQCASKYECGRGGKSFSTTDEADDIISRNVYFYVPSNGYKLTRPTMQLL